MNFKSLILLIAGACCLANGKECTAKCSGGSCSVQKNFTTQACNSQQLFCSTGSCNKTKPNKKSKSKNNRSCSRSCC